MPRKRKHSYYQTRQARRMKLQLETPEQKALRLEKERTRAAARRAGENESQREIRLADGRARKNAVRAGQRSIENSIRQRILAGLTTVENQTLIRLKAQRTLQAKRQAERRRCETPEQRAIRLEKNRIRTASVRANESEEARTIRLARQRCQVNASRLRLRYETQMLSQQKKKFNHFTQSSLIEQTRAIGEMYQQIQVYSSLKTVEGVDCEISFEEETCQENQETGNSDPIQRLMFESA
uniref:STPR domain-containing protein n=1 Tax=Graphocephala atropunctata TaxID=36148 RepID=A0A1B6KFC5_9HEMI